MAMVLRSIYLDPALDDALAGRAETEGTTKAELMRRFLVEGLARPATKYAAYASDASTSKDNPDVVATAVRASHAKPVEATAAPRIPPATATAKTPTKGIIARTTRVAPSRPGVLPRKKSEEESQDAIGNRPAPKPTRPG